LAWSRAQGHPTNFWLGKSHCQERRRGWHTSQLSASLRGGPATRPSALPRSWYMSNRGRYIVEAIVLEHRRPTALAQTHKVSRSWIYKMLERFEQGGYASLEPRSRRHRSCWHQVEARVQKLILRLRRDLSAAGHDAGPHTIHFHLSKKLAEPPSVATIWRILKRHVSSRLSPRNGPGLPSSALPPSCPTKPGRPTPRPGRWPTAVRSRS